MTIQEFSSVFGVLALQLRALDADEATIRSYYAAMKDLDLPLVQMAAERLALQPGTAGEKVWFPGTPEWRGMVAKIESERRDEQLRRIRERIKAGLEPLCAACDDTGFAPVGERLVESCACRKLRRLEVLGLRPMPEQPSAMPAGDPTQETRAMALVRAAVKAIP